MRACTYGLGGEPENYVNKIIWNPNVSVSSSVCSLS
ncbi:hypothetical protein AAZX31_10G203000 [Glycine max]